MNEQYDYWQYGKEYTYDELLKCPECGQDNPFVTRKKSPRLGGIKTTLVEFYCMCGGKWFAIEQPKIISFRLSL